MDFSRVPAQKYKEYFWILFFVFVGGLAIEFVFSMMGHPFVELSVNGKPIVPETTTECLLYAAVSALLFSGIANVFVTLKVIKQACGIYRWPTVAVVLMTLFFALEFLLGVLLVIPNIVFFGIKSRSRDSFGGSDRKPMF